MAAQTLRDFDWLIYFDEATPASFRDRIRCAQSRVGFEARFVGPFTANIAAADVAARVRADDGIVVTSRLDNDDAVAANFLARVREEAARVALGTVINFSNGLALREGRLYSARDGSNPFTSLVESAGAPIRTIWSARHHELGTHWHLHQADGAPAWLQVVHSENVSNRIKGVRVGDRSVIEAFGLGADVSIVAPHPGALAIDRALLAPVRRTRELAIRLVKPLLRRA